MKQIISIYLFAAILACNNKEQDKNTNLIDGKKMLSIVESGYLKDFINFAYEAGYRLTDSTFSYEIAQDVTNNGGTAYYDAKDTSGAGEQLTSAVTKGLLVTYLHVTTSNQQFFNKLKTQFLELGFMVGRRMQNEDGNIEELTKRNNPINIIMMFTEGIQEPYSIFIERKK